jgi:signal transduction histidine kinase/DNA-binding response OmpR family regulator
MLYPGPVKVPENNGCRYLVNYNQKDYNFAEQNWVILQDRRGIIYAANQAGVLECDGVDWGGVVLPRTRSMDMDNSGTIYVGGKDEIGFIDTKADSSLTYVSLLRYLDENELDFGWVMSTHATEAGIYFRTSKFLFRFQPEARELKTWRPLIGESGFAGSFVCRGKLFIRYKNIGLMQMVDDKLESVPGGDLFARRGIYAMFPFNERELVIGTQDGFYLFNGRIMVPFPTEVDDYIKEKQLSHGIRLESSPGLFALSTLRGGLIIIDSRGRLREIFTRDRGLQDDNVKFVFEDSQGNLWLALEKGITKIEYASPFSFYNAEFSGLQGIVLAVVRHGSPGVLHVGTTRGLFILKPGGKFQPVPGITGECFALLSTGGSLLTATNSGLFYFAAKSNNPRPREIIAAPTYFLQTSRQMPGYIWARTNNGLFSLFRQKEDWVVTHRFENISRKNATIVEDERGNLWLGTLTGTNEVLLKIEFPVDNREKKEKGFKKIYYNKSQGPPDEEIRVFRAAGHVIVSTKKGIYPFDEKENRFIPDLTFGKLFADGSRRALYIVEDQNRHIWLHTFRGRFENFRAVPQPKGTYLIEKKPFLRLPNEQINIIYPDPGRSITWFGGNEGLVCFDNRVKKTTVLPFRALVRKVESIVDRSVIFGGNRTGDSFPMPHIEYKDRSIRFRYAAPFFDDESATSYQVYLEGNEKSWGEWTEERRREYPNLDAGYYTFHVRARNVYKNKSREDSFRFRVLPPWYRTWWAYFIYALFSVLCIYLFVKWRSRKLLREKQQLEQVVKDRTKEVYEKNLLLEEQAGKLKELDKAKSRFFANISHEFRTPLTLIMGPLEQVLSGCRDRKQVEDINIALRNSRRLLALINQLLDLSKLESGRMQLQVCRQDMIPFLKGLVGSFESTARQKNLDLSSHAAEEEALLYFDTEKMEKIITNLAANAVKFTPAGGKITVTAAAHTVPDENYPGGYFEIRVGDSGIGIPEKQLPYIFDRFYQAGLTPSRKQRSEGTGIGLALVKELIILHHGEIAVNSREGKGSEFTIRLPMGKRHLKPEEIILDGESLSRTGEMIGPETPAPYLESEVGAGEEEHETEPGEKEKEVILLVEDNPDVRKYIRDPLLSAYTVIEAADGKEGIDRANEIIPDLIISDIMMPEVDGYQLCSVLKKDIRTSHIPIILLTARASEESIIAGLETGADDYITKPFNTHILLTRIKNLIDLRRQLQEKIQREMVLQPTEIAVSSMDREFMKELKEALEKNLSDPDFGVDELTAALYMGRATLNRKIKAITGESTRRFIQSYRLKRAAQLLKANFGNVTEVSFEVGFASSGYFTKCFKKKFHQLPLAFQSAESR